MSIQFVQQKCGSSCGIACVSMVSNVGFDTVLEWSGQPGISAEKLDNLLTKAGRTPIRHKYPTLMPDKVYIVVVPSLNIRAGLHFIVIDTREEAAAEAAKTQPGAWCKIYDPVTGREGKEHYTQDILRSWCEVVEIAELSAD